MLDIIKSFLSPKEIQQSGLMPGQYYERTGSCNTCGKCCTNIYLIHGKKTIDSLELFDELRHENPEYEYFKPVKQEDDGLLFQCIHLQPNNRCGIYESRPELCKKYPSEQSLLMGGKLAEGCGYRFKLLKTFQDVLKQTALKRKQPLPVSLSAVTPHAQ